MSTINRDAYRDALGYLYAKARGDQEAMATLAASGGHARMLDAVADMSLGLAVIATDNQPLLWLDRLREDLEPLLDAAEGIGGDPDAT